MNYDKIKKLIDKNDVLRTEINALYHALGVCRKMDEDSKASIYDIIAFKDGYIQRNCATIAKEMGK